MPSTCTSDSVPGRWIDVCLVVGELAARYLRTILEPGLTLRMLSDKEISRKRGGEKLGSFILLVDTDAIHPPVGRYFRSLRANAPGSKIILLGAELSAEELCGLLFLGIDGFVPYKDIPDTLLLAIDAVSQGHPWIELSVLEKFLSYSRVATGAHGHPSRFRAHSGNSGQEALTARENLVFGLVQRRFSNKEIASALGISENTVKFHVSNIFTKLGVHDRHSVPYLIGSHAPHNASFEPLQVTET